MARRYLVERGKGPAWDHARGRGEQAGCDEHAAFMDRLVEEGVVVLGGPVGGSDGDTVVLVVAAETRRPSARVSRRTRGRRRS